MFEMRLVFSYCEGTYYTQIDNKSREELSPRPLGLSISKILFHEHFLNYSVLDVIIGVGDESNYVLGRGLLFDQKWVCLFWWCRLRGCGLNCFVFGVLLRGISSYL